MDEQLLIDGCMRGESWARKELYEQYAPAMMSVCMRYVGDRETARDLLQDGFVKIFTKIRSYSGSGAFGGWIRRIFVTTALEYLRSSENTRLSVAWTAMTTVWKISTIPYWTVYRRTTCWLAWPNCRRDIVRSSTYMR